MSRNDALERILGTVIAETQEDLVGVWLVLRWVGRAFPELGAAEARKVTLSIVERALITGKVLAGSFSEPPSRAFQLWNLDARRSLERIETSWPATGQGLDIGDNLWLVGKDVDYRAK